jgi:hypothetical protein
VSFPVYPGVYLGVYPGVAALSYYWQDSVCDCTSSFTAESVLLRVNRGDSNRFRMRVKGIRLRFDIDSTKFANSIVIYLCVRFDIFDVGAGVGLLRGVSKS